MKTVKPLKPTVQVFTVSRKFNGDLELVSANAHESETGYRLLDNKHGWMYHTRLNKSQAATSPADAKRMYVKCCETSLEFATKALRRAEEALQAANSFAADRG